MRKYPTVLHCYVRPEEDHYIAICLELDLIDQGKTIEEAKASLEENIALYLETLTPEEVPRFFPRPAPLYIYLDYYRVRLLLGLARLLHTIKLRWAVFVEPVLLKPQLAYHV